MFQSITCIVVRLICKSESRKDFEAISLSNFKILQKKLYLWDSDNSLQGREGNIAGAFYGFLQRAEGLTWTSHSLIGRFTQTMQISNSIKCGLQFVSRGRGVFKFNEIMILCWIIPANRVSCPTLNTTQLAICSNDFAFLIATQVGGDYIRVCRVETLRKAKIERTAVIALTEFAIAPIYQHQVNFATIALAWSTRNM